ncbi:MAG: hypothetical protein Q4E43_07050 [Akkermansia sp.]|nr:hypothetical protein [Akkermansia sp.]
MKLHLPKMLTAALIAAFVTTAAQAATITTPTATNAAGWFTHDGDSWIYSDNYMGSKDAAVASSFSFDDGTGAAIAFGKTDGSRAMYTFAVTVDLSALTTTSDTYLLKANNVTGIGMVGNNRHLTETWQSSNVKYVDTAYSLPTTGIYTIVHSAGDDGAWVAVYNQDGTEVVKGRTGNGGLKGNGKPTNFIIDDSLKGAILTFGIWQTGNNSLSADNMQLAAKAMVDFPLLPSNEYTWVASGESADWDTTSTVWSVDDQPGAKYVSGATSTATFNAGEYAKAVTVKEAIKAEAVNVNDNYKFTVESGSSLTVGTLSVAADTEAIVTGEGSVSLSNVALANGATINMGAAASMGVTVADDADDTAITATKDITLTSLAGPADGKVLTISAEGHTVAVQGNNTFAGDLVVAKGTVKLDSAAKAKSLGAFNGNNEKGKPAPAPNKTITINAGGTIDLNGKADLTYVYTLAGGSLVNNGTGISAGSMQTIGIKLEANSTIGGTGNFYLLGPNYDNTFVELNNYKLTKTGANNVGFRNTNVSAGTIEVQQGNIEFIDGDNSSLAANIILAGGTITGTVRADGEISVTAKQETTLNGLTVRTGQIDIVGTVNVSGGSLDLSINDKSTGTLRVSDGSVLNANSTLWLCSNSKIEVEEGGTFNVAGLSITAPSEDALITSDSNDYYGTGKANFTIANAAITATADVIIGNTLDDVDVHVGAHTVTLNATADVVDVAEGGTLSIGATGSANAINVAGGGAIDTYVKADSGETTITSMGGTVVLKNAIALNAGSLTMTGTYSIDDLDGEIEVTDYVHGEHEDNGFAVETGTIEFVTVAPESGAVLDTTQAQIMRGGNAATVVGGVATVDSTNYATFHITNLSETVTQAKSQEASSGVTLTSIHVDADAELTVDQNINLSLVSAEAGAKLNILSGQTVSVGDATTVATIAGEGTYALKSGSKTMTGTLATGEDWKGTVAVSNVNITDMDLNTYGHEGSKVKFDGVTGYFGTHSITYAPELVLGEGGLTLTDGYSTDGKGGPATEYTFAGGVSGEGSITFNKVGNVTQHLYFTGDVARWTGSLSVVAGFTVYAQYSGVQTVNSIISRTGGTLNVEVGTGDDASVVTYTKAITSNSLTVNAGATAYINGGLTTSTITVADDATLAINGNTTLTSAITSAGTVTLTDVALSDAFTESQGGEAKYYIGETQNYYMGSADKYLTVVTGDGAANATGTGLTWNTRSGLEMANGQVITGAGEANYSTLYVADEIFASDIIAGGHYGDLGTIKVTDGGILTVDQALTGITIEVTDTGVITGTEVVPTDVQIAKDATAEFTADVTGTHYTFSAAEGETVAVTNSGETPAAYTGDNRDLTVVADTLEAETFWEEVTISNIVQVKNVVAGDTTILTLDNVDGTLDLQNLEIGSLAYMQVYASEEHLSENEATVVISETLTAGLGSVLNADLTMKGGSTLDLDGSNGIAALTLGSTLTLDTADGLVNLGEDIISYLSNMKIGESVDLFTHGFGTSLDYGDKYEGAYYDALFVRTDALVGDFTVYADGDHFGLTKYNNVPEPTTGTLSLLALMALAARRRKHN